MRRDRDVDGGDKEAENNNGETGDDKGGDGPTHSGGWGVLTGNMCPQCQGTGGWMGHQIPCIHEGSFLLSFSNQ
jgi:hypothetical protein